MTDTEEFMTIFDSLPPHSRLIVFAAISHMTGNTKNYTYPKAVIKKAVRKCRAILGNPKARADDREHAEHAVAYIREHIKPE